MLRHRKGSVSSMFGWKSIDAMCCHSKDDMIGKGDSNLSANLFFLRMHRTKQHETTAMMHRVNTTVPTIVAIKIIGCLMFTTNNFRSMDTELRTMTSTVNDFTLRTPCGNLWFCWHSSMVVQSSHVSFPSIIYGPSICRTQYSKFGEPLQKMLSS